MERTYAPNINIMTHRMSESINTCISVADCDWPEWEVLWTVFEEPAGQVREFLSWVEVPRVATQRGAADRYI